MTDKTPKECMKIISSAFISNSPINYFYIGSITQSFDGHEGTRYIEFVLHQSSSSITISIKCFYRNLPQAMKTLGLI